MGCKLYFVGRFAAITSQSCCSRPRLSRRLMFSRLPFLSFSPWSLTYSTPGPGFVSCLVSFLCFSFTRLFPRVWSSFCCVWNVSCSLESTARRRRLGCPVSRRSPFNGSQIVPLEVALRVPFSPPMSLAFRTGLSHNNVTVPSGPRPRGPRGFGRRALTRWLQGEEVRAARQRSGSGFERERFRQLGESIRVDAQGSDFECERFREPRRPQAPGESICVDAPGAILTAYIMSASRIPIASR